MASPQGLSTKDIKLSYKTTSAGTTYTELDGLQSVPAMSATPEKIDVTCLADGTRRYVQGVGDFSDFTFNFLYDNSTATSNFRVLKGLETAGDIVYWEMEYPDGTRFDFSGSCVVGTSEGAVNGAITFTLTITLNSAVSIVNPA